VSIADFKLRSRDLTRWAGSIPAGVKIITVKRITASLTTLKAQKSRGMVSIITMQKVSLYVDAVLWKRLDEISKRTMIPKAALLRKAIQNVVKEYSKKA